MADKKAELKEVKDTPAASAIAATTPQSLKEQKEQAEQILEATKTIGDYLSGKIPFDDIYSIALATIALEKADKKCDPTLQLNVDVGLGVSNTLACTGTRFDVKRCQQAREYLKKGINSNNSEPQKQQLKINCYFYLALVNFIRFLHTPNQYHFEQCRNSAANAWPFFRGNIPPILHAILGYIYYATNLMPQAQNFYLWLDPKWQTNLPALFAPPLFSREIQELFVEYQKAMEAITLKSQTPSNITQETTPPPSSLEGKADAAAIALTEQKVFAESLAAAQAKYIAYCQNKDSKNRDAALQAIDYVKKHIPKLNTQKAASQLMLLEGEYFTRRYLNRSSVRVFEQACCTLNAAHPQPFLSPKEKAKCFFELGLLHAAALDHANLRGSLALHFRNAMQYFNQSILTCAAYPDRLCKTLFNMGRTCERMSLLFNDRHHLESATQYYMAAYEVAYRAHNRTNAELCITAIQKTQSILKRLAPNSPVLASQLPAAPDLMPIDPTVVEEEMAISSATSKKCAEIFQQLPFPTTFSLVTPFYFKPPHTPSSAISTELASAAALASSTSHAASAAALASSTSNAASAAAKSTGKRKSGASTLFAAAPADAAASQASQSASNGAAAQSHAAAAAVVSEADVSESVTTPTVAGDLTPRDKRLKSISVKIPPNAEQQPLSAEAAAAKKM